MKRNISIASLGLIFILSIIGINRANAIPVQTRDLHDDEMVVLDAAGNEIASGGFGDPNEGLGNLHFIFSLPFTSPSFTNVDPDTLDSTFFLVENIGGQAVKSDVITLDVAKEQANIFRFTLFAASDGLEENIPLAPGESAITESSNPKGQAVTDLVFANFSPTIFHPDWFIFVRSDADVPEPGSIALFSIGMLGTIISRKRARKGK